ncbi:MAG: (d)CMP kinase [Bacillaceae bacterium]|nr:(d)CMP kinase [Bacillaceae bacterium]
MEKKDIAIAIDGPAAAGKSTVARKVANELSYIYIDTGAMYRTLTFKALTENTDVNNENQLFHLLLTTSIEFKQDNHEQKVLMDGKDVTREIRSSEVTNHVSIVAKHKKVRTEMVKRQQDMAKDRGVVMDGRDIGTHVIPDAEVKVFLSASVEERARRRHKENLEKGFPSSLEQLTEEIRKRDELDSKRETAPLIKADDAVEIDTTSLSIDEVAAKILALAEKKLDEENGDAL